MLSVQLQLLAHPAGAETASESSAPDSRFRALTQAPHCPAAECESLLRVALSFQCYWWARQTASSARQAAAALRGLGSKLGNNEADKICVGAEPAFASSVCLLYCLSSYLLLAGQQVGIIMFRSPLLGRSSCFDDLSSDVQDSSQAAAMLSAPSSARPSTASNRAVMCKGHLRQLPSTSALTTLSAA